MTAEKLRELSNEELMELWNEKCESTYCDDDIVYPMRELDEVLGNQTPSSILKFAEYSDFHLCNDYFSYDQTREEIISSDNVAELIEIDDLCNYLDRTGYDLEDELDEDELSL